MIGMLTLAQLFLLQIPTTGTRFYKEENPKEGIYLLVIVAVVAVIAVVYRLMGGGSRPSSSSSSSKKSGGASPRKFNAFTLLRISSAYGLDREQTKLLEFVFRSDSVNDPERSIQNPALLDRHFKKAYRAIEKNSTTEEDAQARMVKLFALRNIIEASPPPGKEGESTNKLTENTPAVLTVGSNKYPVKVLASKGQTVVTEIPKNAPGSPIRLTKGGTVSLSFFTKSSNGFSLDCQIVGTLNTNQGLGLQLSHTGKSKSLVKRKYRRRESEVRCDIFFVRVDESGAGKKKASKLVVDNKKFTGTIQDISVGGCSLKTITPVQVDSRLKISIEQNDQYQISVLGQVLRINRSGSGGAIVHVKFLKVPRKSFNSISALVYGFMDN